MFAMSDKKQSPAMAFLLAELKKHEQATYAELSEAAEKKELQIYPVMYGRAKTMLGLVKMSKRGQGKAAEAKVIAPQSVTLPSGGSKSAQVRALLSSGMRAADIAEEVGCTVALVYNVKSTSKPGNKGAKRTLRPTPKPSTKTDLSLDSIVRAVQESARETERMRKALEKIQGVLHGV